jgi:hypothetical protein
VLQWNDYERSIYGEDVVDASEIHSSCFASTKDQTRITPLTKSVCFADELVEVFPIKHIDDFSESEVATIWYNGDEYDDIKSDYKTTVFLMECGKELPEDQTSRGLEYRTQQGAWTRYENKKAASNAVLDEQDKQWKADADDFDALARVYMEVSRKCIEDALELARRDALEAQTLYEGLYKLFAPTSAKQITSPTVKRGEICNHKSWRRIFSKK